MKRSQIWKWKHRSWAEPEYEEEDHQSHFDFLSIISIALPAVEFLVLRYFPLLPKMFSYYRVGPKKLKYLVSKQMRKEDIKLIFKVDYVFDYFWNVVNNTWEERMAIDEFWGVWTAMQWLAFCLISLSALDLGHCLGVKYSLSHWKDYLICLVFVFMKFQKSIEKLQD